jgi:hypothetical protein
MLIRLATVALALVTLVAPPARAELQLPRVSQKAIVSQTLGLTDITLVYSRPGVKQRAIWGELVPYDKPWRTGANEATTFTVTGEIQVEGKKLPAGTYSFLTIPTKEEWTVVFSKQKELWGAFDYKPDEDALRVTVKPQSADHEEWMRLSFENLTPNSAELHLRWEKLDVPIRLGADVTGRVLADARREVPAAKSDDWRTPFRAAGYLYDNDLELDQAMTWAKKSVGIDANFNNLSLLAKLQQKEGKTGEAIATAQKAIAAGKASKEKVDTAPTEKLLAEWQAKK